MDEVYTCKCGSQDWVIGSHYVRCVHCKKKVFMIAMPNPARFNAMQSELKDKEASGA